MAASKPVRAPSVEEASEEALVRRFQETGDHGAFAALMQRHLPPIRRLLYVLFNGDPEDIQDAEQEVLIAAYRRLGSFGFRSSLRTFLYALARNRAVDHLRRQRRHVRARQRALAPGGLPGPGDPLDPGDPLEQLLAREREEAVWRAFDSLPAHQRQLLVMKEVEGFSVQEIAAVMALPEGTVKSRLHRGRAQLARILEGRAWT